MANKVLGTAFVSIEAKTDKFLASAQKGISSAATKLGGVFQKPLVAAAGEAGKDAGAAFASGIGGLALAGGLALVGRQITHFALDGVSDFVTLGKAVERFSTVAGVSADAASRFIAVADDFGVSADTASQTVGFLAKTLGNNGKALDSFGVKVVKAKDGTIDLAATSFAVIDAYQSMTDESQKAALGAAAFGRGYQALIPILNQGSAAIEASFKGVSGSQVFDDSKLAKAKALGVTMDNIHDSVLDLQLALADGLAPVLTKISNGLDSLRGGFKTVNDATGGAASHLLELGLAAGGVTVAVTGVIAGVRSVAGVLASASSSFVGFGIAAKGAAGALGAVGAILVAEDILNKITADAGRASRALTEVTLQLDRIRENGSGATNSLVALADAAKELEKSKGDFDKTADAFAVSGPFNLTVSKARLNLLNLKEALDKVLAADPAAGSQIRESLIDTARAADAGDVAARKYLDSLGLTNEEIDKLITKLNQAAIAQGKQTAATKTAAVDLQDLDRHIRNSNAARLDQIATDKIITDAQTKAASDAEAAAAKLNDRYKAEADALDAVKQAKLDQVGLDLSAESAQLRATQAVENYQKALNGVPASLEDIADATKNAADAQKSLSEARVAFEKLRLSHPSVITPEFVLEKQAAADAITAAQAAVDQANAHAEEVKKGTVSTPAEIKAAFIDAQIAINDAAKASADAKEGLLKSLGEPFSLDDETAALVANLETQEKAFGRNSPLGRAIDEHIKQLEDVATAQQELSTDGIQFIAGTASGPQPRHFASGGKFKRGEPIKVGEEGWEILVPDFSGTVLTHEQSVAVTIGASMARASSTSSASAPIPRAFDARPMTGPVTIVESPDGRQTYSEVVRALRSSQWLGGAN